MEIYWWYSQVEYVLSCPLIKAELRKRHTTLGILYAHFSHLDLLILTGWSLLAVVMTWSWEERRGSGWQRMAESALEMAESTVEGTGGRREIATWNKALPVDTTKHWWCVPNIHPSWIVQQTTYTNQLWSLIRSWLPSRLIYSSQIKTKTLPIPLRERPIELHLWGSIKYCT